MRKTDMRTTVGFSVFSDNDVDISNEESVK